MPYCSKCGVQVASTDRFCSKCGSRQPNARPAAADPLSNLSPRNASLLCYIPMVGWIASIVVLASVRFKADQTVRFNAFQGLYLFVAWLIVDWAVGPMFSLSTEHLDFSISAMLKTVLFFTWIFMIIKTSRNETVRLPLLGELAERSIAEQR